MVRALCARRHLFFTPGLMSEREDLRVRSVHIVDQRGSPMGYTAGFLTFPHGVDLSVPTPLPDHNLG